MTDFDRALYDQDDKDTYKEQLRWGLETIDRVLRAAVLIGFLFIVFEICMAFAHRRIDQVRHQGEKYPQCERLGDPVRAAECIIAAEQEERR